MPFKKGDPNINRKGRIDGVKNRVRTATEELLSKVLLDDYEAFLAEFHTLKGRAFTDTYLAIAKLIIPRAADLSISSGDPVKEFLKMSREDQAVIIGEKLNEIEDEN